MPAETTPDGIGYPVIGDNMTPLAGWFAQQAADVQAALTALREEIALPPLPAPVSARGSNVAVVTSTAWADLPGSSPLSLELPRACWVNINFGAWVACDTGDVRASVRVTGATALGETQIEVGGDASAWGQVLFASAGQGNIQASSIRTVRLNAGTNTIQVRAYRTGAAGTQVVNYSTLQVTPTRWA